jgi:uncharacterized protein (DUF433 family)
MQTHVVTHIEIRENHAGQDRAYIAGTRTRVQDVYALAEIQGLTPDQIVQQLPHLTLGQVHAALAYYFDHRQQILAELREDDEFVAALRTRTGPGPLEQRLSGSGEVDAVPP